MIAGEMKGDVFGLTDRGRKREHNEDQFLISDLSKSMLVAQSSLAKTDHERLVGRVQGKLLVVADGLGGHHGGQIASSVAVEAILNYVLNVMPWFYRLNECHEDDLIDELKAALDRCQTAVFAAAAPAGRKGRAMGTTLTLAYVIWPRLYVVHVGDSRCYLLRGADLEQVTKDHTVAQQMLEIGALREEEVATSRMSNTLWQAVGGGREDLSPEVYKAELHPGDMILLCTDGLTKHVSDETIGQQLREGESSEAVVRELVTAANAAGGTDNVTAIVAQFH